MSFPLLASPPHQVSYRLDSASTRTLPSKSSQDMESAMKLTEAKSEAKVKQMANKLDFLKNQLDTEKKALEEVKQAYQIAQQELAGMRDEANGRIRELQQMHAKELQDVEDKVTMNYERRMLELTTLQKQMLSMSSAVQAAEQERLAWKQKEESLQATTSRAQVQAMACKTEVDQLKAQLAGLLQEQQELKKDGNKLSQDAVMRRLDNERHYLKNQLSTEITLKGELQSALTKAQTQLQEVQGQWSEDVNTLKDLLAKKSQELENAQQVWSVDQLSLQTESQRLKHVNAELKDGFIKMRDQLRMEQLMIEGLQSDKQHLQADISHLQAAMQERYRQEEQDLAQHRAQLADQQLILADQEAHYKQEILRLKEELSRQFTDNSQVQASLLKTKHHFAQEEAQVKKLIPVVRIMEALKRWQRNRLQHAYRVWLMNHTLRNVTDQFRTQVEKLIKTTKQDAEAAKTKSLQAQRDQLHSKHMEELDACRQVLSAEANQALAERDQAGQDAVDDLETQHRQLLRQAEEDFTYDMEQLKREHQEAVDVLRDQWKYESANTEQKHRNALEDQAHQHKHDLAKALASKEDEMREQQAVALAALADKHKAVVIKLKSDHDVNLDHQLYQARAAHDKALAQQADKFMVKQAEALQDQRVEHTAEMEQLAVKHQAALDTQQAQLAVEQEKALSAQRSRLQEEEEERLRGLRIVWNEEISAELAAARKTMEDEHIQRMVERDRLKEEDKLKAIRLEAMKWKQIIKDNEQSTALEINKTKIEVAESLEKDFLQIKERLQMGYDLQRNQDQEAHHAAMEEMKRLHHNAFEDWQEEQEAKALQAQEAFQASLQNEYDQVYAKKTAEQMAQQAALFAQELTAEQAKAAKMKEEYASVNSLYAEERNSLLKQIHSFDSKLETWESLKKVEMSQQQKTFEKERELMQLACREQESALLISMENDKASLRIAVEAEERRKHELAWNTERDMLEHDHDLRMEMATEQHNKTIRELEARLHGLEASLQQLQEQFAIKSKALEDTEDNLYDLSTKHKALQKEHSLRTWRFLVHSDRLKRSFKQTQQSIDHQHSQALQSQQTAMRLQYAQLASLVYKLCFYLQCASSKHTDMQNILVSYKMDTIASVKRSIQGIEQEIDLIIVEREASEENREQLVKDIAILTNEIHHNEDELRALQATPAGLLGGHGSININLARKNKRINQEIERLYEQIEAKKALIYETDQTINQKIKEKEDKENILIEHERQLVGIILEQQKFVLKVLKELEGGTGYKSDMGAYKLPMLGTGKSEPTAEEVQEMLRKKWAEDDKQSK